MEGKDGEFDLGPAEFLVLVGHPARDTWTARQLEGWWVCREQVAAEDLRREELAQGG